MKNEKITFSLPGRCNLEQRTCRLLYETPRDLILSFPNQTDTVLKSNWGSPTIHLIAIPEEVESTYVGQIDGSFRIEIRIKPFRRIAFVSCNRLGMQGEKHNYSEVGQYSKLAKTVRYLTVHMGDQVYLDGVPHSENYEQVLADIRKVYRKSWMPIKPALLSSQNLMIPDDHDFVNNLSSNKSISKAFLEASIRCFYEYQYALYADVPANPLPRDVPQLPVYFGETIDNMGLFYLDIRLDRVFNDQGAHNLISDRQFDLLFAKLKEFEENKAVETIVIVSSFPLLYINEMIGNLVIHIDGEIYSLNSEPFRRNVVRLLTFLKDRVKKSVILVAGDHHHYGFSQIRFRNLPDFQISQIVSSGMTEGSTSAKTFSGTVLWALVALFKAEIEGFYLHFPEDSRMYLGTNFVVLDDQSILPYLGRFR
jgi:phosphodiesterase/alkaline phosphatase D-like protein